MSISKVIISSKKNIQSKYGKHFKTVDQLLTTLVKSDKKRDVQTTIIYVDDPVSARKAGIRPVQALTRQSAKNAIDDIYKKIKPVYITIFGSQDIFPFQEIQNPANDDDEVVPTDLPYACDAAFSNKISSFTGPTRVVGRIPDIPGKADTKYLKIVIDSITKHKQVKSEKLMDYFAVTADVWRKSTMQSLSSMFGNNTGLKDCPPAVAPYAASDLKKLTHFYNCHGSPVDSKFYGQKGNNFPTAQFAPNLNGKISKGTIVAAECCYGAEVFDPASEDTNNLSIANTYLKNKAVAFLGSSTVAYGPSSGNALADLITQYFIKNVMNGSSTGSALLEARQKFLSVNGPTLDPYELKTLAQFYLLGDPSMWVVSYEKGRSSSDTAENRRLNFFNKGVNLASSIAPSQKVDLEKQKTKKPVTDQMKKILDKSGFKGKVKENLYEVKLKNKRIEAFAKGFGGAESITYRTFTKMRKKANGFSTFDVLVFKQSGKETLGWRLYHRR